MEFGPTAFLEFKLPIIDSISSSVTTSSKKEFKFQFLRLFEKCLLDFGVFLSIFSAIVPKSLNFLRFFLSLIILSPIFRQVGCVLLDC